MASEFELTREEFVTELVALKELTSADESAGLSPRARIAAGNGAVLLLAALFEEYIRQQVRTAFAAKIASLQPGESLPDKTLGSVWKRSLEILARKPFDELKGDVRATDNVLKDTLGFCLREDWSIDVSRHVSHNENNMKATEINRLFNQVGIKGSLGESCQFGSIVSFLGCQSSGQATAIIEVRIDDFFRRRNDVAHSIQIGASSGPSELNLDIEMFEVIAVAFQEMLDSKFASAVG